MVDAGPILLLASQVWQYLNKPIGAASVRLAEAEPCEVLSSDRHEFRNWMQKVSVVITTCAGSMAGVQTSQP